MLSISLQQQPSWLMQKGYCVWLFSYVSGAIPNVPQDVHWIIPRIAHGDVNWKAQEVLPTQHPSSMPLSNVSFYVQILGSKKGTCLSYGPALRGFQKGKLTYSFERISCSGHLKSESAVVRVHWCDPGLRGWSVGWSPQNHPGWL